MSKIYTSSLVISILLLMAGCAAELTVDDNSYRTWSHYNGDKMGSKYSALNQINQENVKDLKLKWKFETEELSGSPWSKIECNPLILDHVIYLVSASVAVIALDAKSGKEIWRYDADPTKKSLGLNRGLAYWSNGDTTRLFFSKGNYLYCLDAAKGTLISNFGDAGRINLKDGLNREADNRNKSTTPGVIFKDLYILGSTVGEGPGPAAPGYIRAFDVRTGATVWTFHTIPLPGEPGYETWPPEAWKTSGGANSWGGITMDEQRGVIYCGTGSPAYDHWGGDRKGQNLYANCVLALDAASGKKVWHYQVVHHDIWDYDIPCAPNLVQVEREGILIDAVAQPTKMGHLFILNRDTGQPIFPIEEVAVPRSAIPGEESWPTQPMPIQSLRYTRQGFSAEEITDLSPAATAFVKDQIKHMEMGAIFRPPGKDSALIMPQFNGGTDWGGAAYDPIKRKLFVNASNEAEWISMFEAPRNEKISQNELGSKIYQTQCTFCHGTSSQVPGQGAHSLASLKTIVSNRPLDESINLLKSGRGQMPKFDWLSDEEKQAVVSYLNDSGNDVELDLDKISINFASSVPWLATGHNPIKDHEGYPINKRPWGTLSSIDMDSGTIDWQVPLGTYPALEAKGFAPTGTFNLGGPMVTAGGLVFIAATMDERFRAFDMDSGEVRWEFQMDAGGYATPATYEVDGIQYIIIAAGGGGIPGTPPGNAYYCFSL